MKLPGPSVLLLALVPGLAVAASPRVITSTATQPWHEHACEVPAPGGGAEESWVFKDSVQYQRMEGFGGCFNEQGWAMLSLLNASKRAEVMRNLFDPGTGCGFNLGRLPMGANDYSLDWFSYDETPEDYDLKDFSIERDRRTLIPYVKEALGIASRITLWSSPWCPPSWMKTNHHYAGAPSSNNDLKPEQAGREMVTQFRMEPRVLEAYARYFVRYVEEYAKAGLQISAVHVQNEPNSAQNFPSCVWTPADLGTFAVRHLGPTLAKSGLPVQLWLGTIERGQLERVKTILDMDAGTHYIHGVGFQWAGKDAIPLVHKAYPKLPLIQTESECGNGSNDWAAARHTFGLMHHYLSNGASAYLYWNMVLDETGNSRWGWRQNALITINRKTLEVTYNPEYYLFKHIAPYVHAGAVRVGIDGASQPVLAFVNSDGTRVLVCENSRPTPLVVDVLVNGTPLRVTFPADSFATVLF